MIPSISLVIFLVTSFFTAPSLCINVDFNDTASVQNACSTIINNILTIYTGDRPGGTPGVLPKPYYWWQSGALWGELIEYWSYTGDSTYNGLVTQALAFQIGPSKSFMPENVTREEGNDDQAFWAFAAMTAAELGLPDPPKEKSPSWVALAQAVFNNQAGRWDMQYCGGGLRWQIYTVNPGYDYKNTISNGAFFQLSSRLARYTGMYQVLQNQSKSSTKSTVGNETYKEWADKAYDWLASTPNLTPTFEVNDGSAIRYNCTDANHDQWTYNYGTIIAGSAYMYSITTGEEAQKWRTRVDGLLKTFFSRFYAPPMLNPPGNPNILVELNCEPQRKCNPDQTSFKAYASRWLALTSQLCPWTADLIMPKIRASAIGAAKQCSGGETGSWCGQNWNAPQWDGFLGVGEQMSALATIGATLMPDTPLPLTARTGGVSVGDPNAGGQQPKFQFYKISNADIGGAYFLTFFSTFSVIVGALWMASTLGD